MFNDRHHTERRKVTCLTVLPRILAHCQSSLGYISEERPNQDTSASLNCSPSRKTFRIFFFSDTTTASEEDIAPGARQPKNMAVHNLNSLPVISGNLKCSYRGYLSYVSLLLTRLQPTPWCQHGTLYHPYRRNNSIIYPSSSDMLLCTRSLVPNPFLYTCPATRPGHGCPSMSFVPYSSTRISGEPITTMKRLHPLCGRGRVGCIARQGYANVMQTLNKSWYLACMPI